MLNSLLYIFRECNISKRQSTPNLWNTVLNFDCFGLLNFVQHILFLLKVIDNVCGKKVTLATSLLNFISGCLFHDENGLIILHCHCQDRGGMT